MAAAWKSIAAVLGYHVELKSENPYGEVLNGWIRLCAPLVPLSLSDVLEKEEDKLLQPEMRLKTTWGNPFGEYAGFDNINQKDEGARALVMSFELFALVLVQNEAYVKDSGIVYNSLIVVEEDSSSGSRRIRRMGFIFLTSETLGNFKVIENSSEFATVTLV